MQSSCQADGCTCCSTDFSLLRKGFCITQDLCNEADPKDDGEDCDADEECLSGICDPDQKKCMPHPGQAFNVYPVTAKKDPSSYTGCISCTFTSYYWGNDSKCTATAGSIKTPLDCIRMAKPAESHSIMMVEKKDKKEETYQAKY